MSPGIHSLSSWPPGRGVSTVVAKATSERMAARRDLIHQQQAAWRAFASIGRRPWNLLGDRHGGNIQGGSAELWFGTRAVSSILIRPSR